MPERRGIGVRLHGGSPVRPNITTLATTPAAATRRTSIDNAAASAMHRRAEARELAIDQRRQRHIVHRQAEQGRDAEIADAGDEDEQAGADEMGPQQRQQDFARTSAGRRAVELRRLDQAARNGPQPERRA